MMVSGKLDATKSFGETATALSKNPLGIIALFIVLVYGIAALVTVVPTSLTVTDRAPLIYFLVLFPILVLALFGWIVVYKPVNLFGPQDFKNEENYVTLVASLTAATLRRPDGIAQQAHVDVRKIAETARNLAPAAKDKSRSTRILWVDDHPESNDFERQAFETLGLTFTLALSTDQALKLAKDDDFAAIIFDMGRKDGPQEGYVLLDTLRKQGNKTPFFIYASSNSPAHKREAANRGAQGSTNNPQELVQMVTAKILN
ncbi:MAG TPA: response regulator [Xanthobacteraceae bacterium]|jgi:CheY-like chemotaxis protein|nr:response regulator [Xanthobacteraceae bacterium]